MTTRTAAAATTTAASTLTLAAKRQNKSSTLAKRCRFSVLASTSTSPILPREDCATIGSNSSNSNSNSRTTNHAHGYLHFDSNPRFGIHGNPHATRMHTGRCHEIPCLSVAHPRSFSSVSSPTKTTESGERSFDYDLFVIGAGSGGIASARRASSTWNKRVAVAECGHVGGTCVNAGCVPKKILWNAASIAETVHEMHHYGFAATTLITNAGGNSNNNAHNSINATNTTTNTAAIAFDWAFLKDQREQYVQKLHGIYERNLKNSGVSRYNGTASLGTEPHTIHIEMVEEVKDLTEEKALNITTRTITKTVTAKHILIATGGSPVLPEEPGVAEHCVTSDGFFYELDEQPLTAVVVGGGYIAVELAGVLQALGTETKLVLRKEQALRSFDPLVRDTLDEEMLKQGIEIHRNTGGIERVVLVEDDEDDKSENENDDIHHDPSKTVYLKNGEIIENVDVVIVAPGRAPLVEPLKPQNRGVLLDEKTGHIITDEFSETSADGVYAVGDVAGPIELTPVAIAAGRRLADRLFGKDSSGGNNSANPLWSEGLVPTQSKVSYENVPSVVFSHPPVGTIGMTEPEAIEHYGRDGIKVYQSKFANLYYGIWSNNNSNEPCPTTFASSNSTNPSAAAASGHLVSKPKTAMKLICHGPNERVVGLHVIGMRADELLQGFGVAIKMGATKADFDDCMAIHPTAAEELVTLHPWGLKQQPRNDEDSS